MTSAEVSPPVLHPICNQAGRNTGRNISIYWYVIMAKPFFVRMLCLLLTCTGKKMLSALLSTLGEFL